MSTLSLPSCGQMRSRQAFKHTTRVHRHSYEVLLQLLKLLQLLNIKTALATDYVTDYVSCDRLCDSTTIYIGTVLSHSQGRFQVGQIGDHSVRARASL